jgi:hypothetical protein
MTHAGRLGFGHTRRAVTVGTRRVVGGTRRSAALGAGGCPARPGGMGEPGIRSALSPDLSNDGLQRYAHYVFNRASSPELRQGSSGTRVTDAPSTMTQFDVKFVCGDVSTSDAARSVRPTRQISVFRRTGCKACHVSGWVAISTRATVMLSGAPAAMVAFHSSKVAAPPSWRRSMAVIAVSLTASVSPSLQIR